MFSLEVATEENIHFKSECRVPLTARFQYKEGSLCPQKLRYSVIEVVMLCRSYNYSHLDN